MTHAREKVGRRFSGRIIKEQRGETGVKKEIKKIKLKYSLKEKKVSEQSATGIRSVTCHCDGGNS